PVLAGDKPQENYYLDQVLPQAVVFKASAFQRSKNDVISFLLGGGECRWNNVRMAEAAARLVTRPQEKARLQSLASLAADNPPLMPAPLNNPQWRTAHLIMPLRGVGETGTAHDLNGLARAPYMAIYKTGTIQEANDQRESETLLFVIGQWRDGSFVAGR